MRFPSLLLIMLVITIIVQTRINIVFVGEVAPACGQVEAELDRSVGLASESICWECAGADPGLV